MLLAGEVASLLCQYEFIHIRNFLYLTRFKSSNVNAYGLVYDADRPYRPESDTAKLVPSARDWVAALALVGVVDHAWEALQASLHQPAWYPRKLIVPPAKLHDHYIALSIRFAERKQELQLRLTGLADARYANKSCVVVGAAPALAGSRLGAWIDSHDYVWRANHHVPGFDGYSVEDAGHRTDRLFLSDFHLKAGHESVKAAKFLRDSDPEAQIVIWPPGDGLPQTADPWLKQQDHYSFVSTEVTAAVNEVIDTVAKVGCRTVRPGAVCLLKDTSISPRLNFSFWQGVFCHSTGLFMAHYAWFSCARVSLVGFGTGRATLYNHGVLSQYIPAELVFLLIQPGLW